MDAQQLTPDVLNEQQLMMLRLLKTPMPDSDFTQIRRLAVKLLAKQLDEKVADWEEKNNIDAEYYDQLSQKHFRSSSKS